MHPNDIISFGWWNTGLHPPRKPATPTDEQRECARQVIGKLMVEVDLLALGEVTTTEAEQIRRGCCSAPYELLVEGKQDRDPRRNLAVIYNTDRLQLIAERRTLYDTQEGSRRHVGEHLLFSTSQFTAHIHVFVVHWPSRKMREADELRSTLGRNPQARIEALSSGGARRPHVLVLGDFNDEPFDESLSRALLGSRDRNLVRRETRRLYNPFWRLLGEQQSVEEEVRGRLGAGTHYFNQTRAATNWHTYDQFLVSSSLLANSGWVLIERGTRVWQNAPLLDASGHLAPRFDHFPILGTLAYVAPAEISSGA